MLRLYKLVVLPLAFYLHGANAAFIDILEDHTSAYAQVTYDAAPDVVNPGTTMQSFDGALFPGGSFIGYELRGDREVIVDLGEGYQDKEAYSSVNAADIYDDYFRFTSVIGPIDYSGLNVSGNASAQTDIHLKFMVSEGSSFLDYALDNESAFSPFLTLFDETAGVMVADVMQTGFGHTAGNLMLYAEHTYILNAHSYFYTPLSGDPAGMMFLKFADEIRVSEVPVPRSWGLLLFGLTLLGVARFCK